MRPQSGSDYQERLRLTARVVIILLVTAPAAGKVSAFRVGNEQTVTAGQVLVVLEPASS